MTNQPVFSEAEWDLVVELLRRELLELPSEIHHTHARDYRQRLVERRKMIEGLLERLGAQATA